MPRCIACFTLSTAITVPKEVAKVMIVAVPARVAVVMVVDDLLVRVIFG